MKLIKNVSLHSLFIFMVGVSEERIIGMDIYPTMLSAAGIPLNEKQHVDGLNLVPLLTKGKKLKERPLVFHYPHYTHATGPFSSIIKDGWKLIHFYNDQQGAYLLYDLNVDREEQNNLADSNPEMLNDLLNHLSSLLTEMDAEMPISNPDYDSKSEGKKKTLQSTKRLAEWERSKFEKRLKQK